MNNSEHLKSLLPSRAGAVLVLALLVGVAVSGRPQTALAQAGQTGGVIGKQEKSISSEEGAPEPRGAAPARRSSGGARQTRTLAQGGSSGCGRIVGTWRWLVGMRAVFNANGTNHASNGDSGTWTCAGGTVVASWKSGYVDTITFSSATSLSITNSAGLHFSAHR
ncbi:MAG: hypothetical protein HY852_20945 [Bradyrhizobium sp.]|uniref:hypothetical protein n=1 Tax=Bradyrhizobium sp. TaxID=376 RepID=UPI0025C0F43A|nr:hypothetical protein [Bradyrhizobium sp.]MBI5264278.1 hypothetical protein [Bradyrhizobium sp.]